jgi:hypothetical protein
MWVSIKWQSANEVRLAPAFLMAEWDQLPGLGAASGVVIGLQDWP